MFTYKTVDKRIQRSKLAFREALIKLLKQKSSDNISVKDIIDCAGYSRGTFYAYYRDKDDFILSVLSDEINSYVEIIYGTISKNNSITFGDSIYEPALNFFQYVYENREVYKLIFNVNIHESTLDYFCEKAYNEFIQKIDIELLESSPTMDIDFYFYSFTYLYMIFVKYWIKNDFKYSPQYMAEQVTILNTKKVHKVAPKRKKK